MTVVPVRHYLEVQSQNLHTRTDTCQKFPILRGSRIFNLHIF